MDINIFIDPSSAVINSHYFFLSEKYYYENHDFYPKSFSFLDPALYIFSNGFQIINTMSFICVVIQT